MTKFWMVLCDRGNHSPKYYTCGEAEKQAATDAKKSPGKSFVVLEAVGVFQAEVTEPQCTHLLPHRALALVGQRVAYRIVSDDPWDPLESDESESARLSAKGTVVGFNSLTERLLISPLGSDDVTDIGMNQLIKEAN